MLGRDKTLMTVAVELVLKATENDPYVTDDFTHMWVDDDVLYIKMEKIFSVMGANYILENFYKEKLLENKYSLRIGDSNYVYLIRQKDEGPLGIYLEGSLIKLCLGNYEILESALTFEASEPALIFEDLLSIC